MNVGDSVPKSPVKHVMTRRASFHDYKLPSIYMFTIFRDPNSPALSEVVGNPYIEEGPDAPGTRLSGIGRILEEELQKTEAMRRGTIRVLNYVIMPDHAHILLQVTQKLTVPVTSVVSAIESAVTSGSRKAGLIASEATVFKGKGINDRIIWDNQRYETVRNYINDNPRRLLIKRMNPDLFRRNLSVRIGDETIDCVGNMFLLRKPMLQVHVRRAWDSARVRDYKKYCIEEALDGTVLVSPFIHPVENEIRKKVLESGGSLIHILDHGFGERFKPTGRGLDTCAEGRMLLVCEGGASVLGEDMSYAKASRLNRLAQRLAALTPDAKCFISRVCNAAPEVL